MINKTPYTYVVINEINGKAKDLAKLETLIIQEMMEMKHTPSQKFEGWTECFKETAINKILPLMRTNNDI